MTALASCAFATADLVVGNVERLRQYVRSGLFDALLVRPLSSLAQLVAMDVATRRVGRVVFGVVMLVLALANAPVKFTPARLALLTDAHHGAVIFRAVFVAGRGGVLVDRVGELLISPADSPSRSIRSRSTACCSAGCSPTPLGSPSWRTIRPWR